MQIQNKYSLGADPLHIAKTSEWKGPDACYPSPPISYEQGGIDAQQFVLALVDLRPAIAHDAPGTRFTRGPSPHRTGPATG